ncbi:MAG: hypothetical protein J0I17_05860 ['Candidatus Kapabacteria' thiocyanatum]|uniref:HYDIN/VesB/CFA65-like Ig-like domain-containing protein n=1 Tax=Candidatus Kapaibacterium thiocyanatum TaxID=1895771 RepID=A0A1M3L6C6_9BACT|nr:hypothetical protein ['Candidatus Kapabacteria' thiocyanatum]OJX61110.1 MAG: hypothetical protein BGO89_00480 ['Candidatus Kapabacteria' thiocyanatum]
MNARSLVRTLAVGVCTFAVGAMSLMAQNSFDRVSLIEQFTSATCGPCVAAGPVMARVVKLSNGVVSIRYHMSFPAEGDPWNVSNPSENSSRQMLYSVNSIPTSQVNGKSKVDPRDEATLLSTISTDAAVKSPVQMTVTQSGGSVAVKIKTNIDLNAHKLQVAVVSRRTVLPNLPSTLANSNGESEFFDAMVKMLPNASGTSLSQSAGGEQTYNFTFAPGTGELWPSGMQYIVAFVQSTGSTKEIIQAGTNLDEVMPNVTMAGAKWQYITKGGQKTAVLTLSNPRDKAMDVEVSIPNRANLQQMGVTVTADKDVVSIPAKGSVTVNISVTAPNAAMFIPVQVEAKPINLTTGIPATATVEFGYLTEGARFASYYGASDGAVALHASAIASEYGNDAVFMPLATEIVNAYPPTSFDAIGFSVDYYSRGALLNGLPIVQAVMQAGKGAWVTGEVEQAIAYNNAGFESVKTFFENTLQLQPWGQANTVQRYTQTGQNISLQTFPIKGINGDPIGEGLNATGNQYNQQTWPFWVRVTDLLKPKVGATSVLSASFDNNVANGATVRVVASNGAKLVYSSFGQEAIADATQRNGNANRTLKWLLASALPQITASVPQLNFGDVKESTSKDMTVTFSNSGQAELRITEMNLTGADASAFDIISGAPDNQPIVLSAGQSRTVKVRFYPLTVKSGFVASLQVICNAASNPSVQLLGNGTPSTSVETEVASESGALGMRLVGANPVSVSSEVEVKSTSSDVVTVSVVDNMGRTVATLFNAPVAGSQRVALSSAALANGMYTVVATNGNERVALTMVVAR